MLRSKDDLYCVSFSRYFPKKQIKLPLLLLVLVTSSLHLTSDDS